MNVAFRTRQLLQAYEESARAARLWGEAVAKKYVMRIAVLQSARDFGDIRALASLRAHRLRGARLGQWAIDLTGRYRLILRLNEAGDEVTIEEVSVHYGD